MVTLFFEAISSDAAEAPQCVRMWDCCANLDYGVLEPDDMYLSHAGKSHSLRDIVSRFGVQKISDWFNVIKEIGVCENGWVIIPYYNASCSAGINASIKTYIHHCVHRVE